jgi:hypothetical protein
MIARNVVAEIVARVALTCVHPLIVTRLPLGRQRASPWTVKVDAIGTVRIRDCCEGDWTAPHCRVWLGTIYLRISNHLVSDHNDTNCRLGSRQVSEYECHVS